MRKTQIIFFLIIVVLIIVLYIYYRKKAASKSTNNQANSDSFDISASTNTKTEITITDAYISNGDEKRNTTGYFIHAKITVFNPPKTGVLEVFGNDTKLKSIPLTDIKPNEEFYFREQIKSFEIKYNLVAKIGSIVSNEKNIIKDF